MSNQNSSLKREIISKNRVIDITKAGWIFILISILLGFAAINTGNNLIFIIDSFLLGIMGVSGFFGKINIDNLGIEVTAPKKIYAKTKFPLKIKITNRKKFLPSFIIKVKVDKKTFLLPYLKIGEENSQIHHIDTQFDKRGINHLEYATISSQFPFSFFTRYTYKKLNFSKITYPYPLKREYEYFFIGKNSKQGLSDNLNIGVGTDIFSIKNYTQNEHIRDILWKYLPKIDKLLIKERATDYTPPIIINFEDIKIDNIEEKLSLFTYILISLDKKGVSFNFIMNNRNFNLLDDILKEFALY